MSRHPSPSAPDGCVDVLIVGGGPTGIAAGLFARRAGLSQLVLERGTLVNSIVNYPVGMTFFSTTDRLSLGGLPFTSANHRPSRSEAIRYYRSVAEFEGVAFRLGVEVESCRPDKEGFVVQTSAGEFRGKNVVLATGYFDRTNRLNVPGEDLPHVSHYYDEPWHWYDRDVIVIGGRNSAVETALDLYRAGARVTVVHRRQELGEKIKYWLRPDFENRVAEGGIGLNLGCVVSEIEPEAVRIRDLGTDETTVLPADGVFAMIGYRPDAGLFDRFGIPYDPESLVPEYDPESFATPIPGLYLAGSVACGCRTWEIFIENGREHAEQVISTISERIGPGDRK